MKKFFNWIWYSSVDPSAVSAAVKSFGLTLIPVIIAMGNGYFQLGLEQDTLVSASTDISVVVFSVLTAFFTVRKIWYTFVTKK